MTCSPAPASRPPEWKTDRLADSVMALLALTALQRLMGFVRGILFCRWLEPAELGQWDMALSFIELAAPLMMLGLPGSFGRYVEHYRQQGQLRTFLRRTTLVTIMAAGCALMFVVTCHDWFSYVVFGTRDNSRLVYLLATGLAAVGCYNVITF